MRHFERGPKTIGAISCRIVDLQQHNRAIFHHFLLQDVDMRVSFVIHEGEQIENIYISFVLF